MTRFKLPKVVLSLFAACLLTASAGCGGGAGDPEAVLERSMEQMISLFSDVTDAMATIEDHDSANTVAARIEREFIPRMMRIGEGMAAVKNAMTEAEWEAFEERTDVRMEEQFGPAFERAMERFMDQVFRVMPNPQLASSALIEAFEKWDQANETIDF